MKLYKQRIVIATLVTLASVPLLASAEVDSIFGLGRMFISLIGKIMQLLWILAIMSFLWGLVEYIHKADDKAARAKGKTFMVWSVVAFTITISFWALVSFVIGSATLTPDSGGVNIVDSASVVL